MLTPAPSFFCDASSSPTVWSGGVILLLCVASYALWFVWFAQVDKRDHG